MATAIIPNIKHLPPFQVQTVEGLWIKDVDEEGNLILTQNQAEAFTFNGQLRGRWQAQAGYTVVTTKKN